MMKFKISVYKIIWKIAGISPNWGNRVMDFLGDGLYSKIGKTLYDMHYLN